MANYKRNCIHHVRDNDYYRPSRLNKVHLLGRGDPDKVTTLGILVVSIRDALIYSKLSSDTRLTNFVNSIYEDTFEQTIILYIQQEVVPAAQSFLDYYYTMTEQQWAKIWGNPRNMHWIELWKRIRYLKRKWYGKRYLWSLEEELEPWWIELSHVSQPKKGYRHDREH